MARTKAQASSRVPAPPMPPLPRAAWVLLIMLTAAALMALTCYPIYDTDLWQHLLVGKVMWTQHTIPHTQLWTWPTHGAPDVMPSWLFRALLYPFWAAGGLAGITVWRWLTTLDAFGFLWAPARARGARGGTGGITPVPSWARTTDTSPVGSRKALAASEVPASPRPSVASLRNFQPGRARSCAGLATHGCSMPLTKIWLGFI